MNNTLENLLYCSGLTAQGGWDQLDSYQQQCVLKLVELTVCECANLTCWQEYDMSAEQRVRLEIYQNIKQHFGV